MKINLELYLNLPDYKGDPDSFLVEQGHAVDRVPSYCIEDVENKHNDD